MADSRSKFEIRLAGLKRHLLWYGLSRRLNLILVTEYPKSGASWIAQMLSDYFELPFRRNTSARFERSVMHGHYLPSPRFNKPIAVVRDGRDIVVSYYYHMLIGNEKMPSYSVDEARRRVRFDDYEDIRGNLPAFIDYLFSDYLERQGVMYFSWTDFVDKALLNEAILVKYENVNRDAFEEMTSVLSSLGVDSVDEERLALIVDKYSFKSLSGRQAGSEDQASYLRKGIVGDWKNHFSPDARAVFARHAQSHLELLGYEQDDSWISG